MRTDDKAFLRRKSRPAYFTREDSAIRVVDLFCGCGGMTLGIAEAARRTNATVSVAFALDADDSAVRVFEQNIGAARCDKIEHWVGGQSGRPLSAAERLLRQAAGRVDVLVGGPPCQGVSDLNNVTRRLDPRNELYFRMARAAEVLRPAVVLIENVPAVIHDRNAVVKRTRDALVRSGYATWEGTLSLEALGVPQRRRRHFLLGVVESLVAKGCPHDLSASLRPRLRRSVRWAIEDLEAREGLTEFDVPSQPSEKASHRIKWLFQHDAYQLPDHLRPPCHSKGGHSYRSVYGRMRWADPSPTITSGFGCMGQGCFVHPRKPRTITPHEAARLQAFPDFFTFGSARSRTERARLIGNAVPPLAIVHLMQPIIGVLRAPH